MKINWKDVFKFLSGAFFVSGGILFYLYLTGVSVPLLGTSFVETPEISGVRSIIHFIFFLICFYFGFIKKPKDSSKISGLKAKFVNLLKSILHNIGVVIVGLGVAFLGTRLDSLLGIGGFNSLFTNAAAWLLLIIGFLLRVWATFHFYEHRMKVISLMPQKTLITYGPYRFSRNPLYLGGDVFIFFGAALLLGSPSGLFLTAIHPPFMDLWIRREENNWRRNLARSGKKEGQGQVYNVAVLLSRAQNLSRR